MYRILALTIMGERSSQCSFSKHENQVQKPENFTQPLNGRAVILTMVLWNQSRICFPHCKAFEEMMLLYFGPNL